MLCSVSGHPCEEPVFCLKTGFIFEKRLIEKQILAVHKCPHTDVELTIEDLMPVNGFSKNVAPRAPTHTSIPSMLKSFQNEWDSLMLETFKLKQHVETVRQELSHALYQHDAACRVIARLTLERDRALKELADANRDIKSAMSDMQPTNGNNDSVPSAMEIDSERTGLSQELVDQIKTRAELLNKRRKKAYRKFSSVFPSQEKIGSYVVKATSNNPNAVGGLSCIDLHPNPEMQKYVVGGSNDGSIVLFNRESNENERQLNGHSSKVTSVQFHPTEPAILSASDDCSVCLWNYNTDENEWRIGVKTDFESGVVGAEVHPLGTHVISATTNGVWSVHSIDGRPVLQSPQKRGFTTMKLHPDGQIMATGGLDDLVKIWDIRSSMNVTTFSGHSGITSFSYSDNGFVLSSSDTNGVVKIWDLRKLSTLKTLDSVGESIYSLQFDKSREFLAVGRSYGIDLVNVKDWTTFSSLRGHDKNVTGIRFGVGSTCIVTGSNDQKINIYSTQDANI